MSRPYAGPIVDAHHHLWDYRMGRHPWLAPAQDGHGGLGGLAPLRRDYLPADYARDAVNQNIAATVHIEASWAPEDCVGVLDAFAEVGVDQVIIHMQMGDVPHERIMESIEMIGTELIPRYR